AILVPDSEFFDSSGHAAVRALAGLPWHERSDTVLWRGASTGAGAVAVADMSPSNPALIQRTRVCLALRGMTGVDARLCTVVQASDAQGERRQLQEARIFGEWLRPAVWARHKYALDIDGNSNAWSNLFQRLLLGCCVIKVGSPRG